tara:strand:+ start:834 stop:1034 length:201 start_codon:yes stop_codon:yes gene_type:complete
MVHARLLLAKTRMMTSSKVDTATLRAKDLLRSDGRYVKKNTQQYLRGRAACHEDMTMHDESTFAQH